MLGEYSAKRIKGLCLFWEEGKAITSILQHRYTIILFLSIPRILSISEQYFVPTILCSPHLILSFCNSTSTTLCYLSVPFLGGPPSFLLIYMFFLKTKQNKKNSRSFLSFLLNYAGFYFPFCSLIGIVCSRGFCLLFSASIYPELLFPLCCPVIESYLYML